MHPFLLFTQLQWIIHSVFLSLYNQKPSTLNIGFQSKEKTTQVLFPWFEAWKLFGSLGYSDISYIPSGHSCNTGLNWPNTNKSSISDVSLGFSSRSGFLSISKLNMCKANLVSLASKAGGNWIHAMLKPLVGENGGVVQHLFFLNGIVYFSLPSIFSLILV